MIGDRFGAVGGPSPHIVTSRQTGGALGVALFAALAGPATGTSFTAHACALFLAAAVTFAVLGVLCGVGSRYLAERTASPDLQSPTMVRTKRINS
ncbi:hypothetical protein AB0L82_42655 [Nocardia sp. NPDC052001]|uniref:hypothetical protein n=1 Tax=Nocardia sp. NPDC052001 TaxID=3154853 RepID=UPI003448885D